MRNLAIALVAALALAAPASAQQADTILINGKVLTVDATFSQQEARGRPRGPHHGGRPYRRHSEAGGTAHAHD